MSYGVFPAKSCKMKNEERRRFYLKRWKVRDR